MHVIGFILITWFGCDDLRTPQACCTERAARHEEHCVGSTQAMDCSTQSEIVLSVCMDIPGDTMLAGSSTCVAFCQQIGDALYAGCRAEGGSGYECGQLSQSFMATCFVEDCGLEPPGPTCDEVCQNISISAFGECMLTGGDYQVCGEVADVSYLGCLSGNCNVDAPEMACDFSCFRLAQDFFYACREISGNDLACIESAETIREICVEQTCVVGDDCTEDCPFIVADDEVGDAVPRLTNASAQDRFDPERPLIDLISSTLGKWQPHEPQKDLYTGEYRFDGRFFKLELELAGLVNPPGSLRKDEYWPQQFGPNPVYGFVEIDIDANVMTGGDVDEPELRYLGNAVRFGGRVPNQSFSNRLALDGSAFDGDLSTPPFVERHGEDFHLSLLGPDRTDSHTPLVGDIDGKFEEGETWLLHGSFLHRAHAYEHLDLLYSTYDPDSDLLWHHDIQTDTTHITLVFPLTNFAAGLMRGEPPEPNDQAGFNHASIDEAIHELRFWAEYWATADDSPLEDLIIGWNSVTQDPLQLLDPTNWTYTVLLGTYNESFAEEGIAVWTDIYPDVVPGDIVGTGIRTGYDGELISEFVQAHDGDDGVVDERVVLANFATNFSLYDVNHDGVVDGQDIIFTNGDANQDGAVDLADFALFQRCFEKDARFPPCASLDLSGNTVVEIEDFPQFFQRFEGPAR